MPQDYENDDFNNKRSRTGRDSYARRDSGDRYNDIKERDYRSRNQNQQSTWTRERTFDKQSSRYYNQNQNRGFRTDDRKRGWDQKPSVRKPSPTFESYPFTKNFYEPTNNLTPAEVAKFREENFMTIKGNDVPDPVFSLTALDIFKDVHSKLASSFSKPTPIQAQGWPMALQGRDMVGIAQTGSGKTLSFVLPALIHAKAQERKGPIVLVLAPTRELAMQISKVFNEYEKCYRLRTCVVYGGQSIHGQRREIEYGCDILVATPGRLIDCFEQNIIDLKHVTFLILDEADRMLDMGFEPQLRRIIPLTNKERQTLMWSATWPREVKDLAESYMNDYIQVNIGQEELNVNAKIDQKIKVVQNYDKKGLLFDLLKNYKGDKIIIFCNTKRMCDDLENILLDKGYKAAAIHGDKSQNARDSVIGRFRDGIRNILIATDVAARGLDVKDVKLVVNYDFPKQVEDYVHRIGRTGRGEAKTGLSVSFFTRENENCAKELVKVLEDSNKEVPSELKSMAAKGGRSGYRRRW